MLMVQKSHSQAPDMYLQYQLVIAGFLPSTVFHPILIANPTIFAARAPLVEPGPIGRHGQRKDATTGGRERKGSSEKQHLAADIYKMGH